MVGLTYFVSFVNSCYEFTTVGAFCAREREREIEENRRFKNPRTEKTDLQ